ncbi:hypothetical protein ACX0MV_10565 [Pseudomonas borbori]
MSPLVITLLIVGGIFILIAIAYINNMVENNKLEKARLKADLADRVRRCADVSDALPGQLVSPQLKLMLSRLQLHFNERLLLLDKNNAQFKAKVGELQRLIALGESIPVSNPPQKIMTEAKAKEVRFQLENLHNLITRSARDGVLAAKEAQHWVKEVQHMLVQLHIEFFSNLGLQAVQQNQPGQARLALERGVQYLRKQADPARYQADLQRMDSHLARANAMVLDKSQPASAGESELTQGLSSLETEEDWKKKTLYD